MTMFPSCIRDNVAAIGQGIDLLGKLGPADYARRIPACFNSAAGGHMRHVIEHYLGFLRGLETGEVDYEARARDPRIEADPAYAASRLEAVRRRLLEASAIAADLPLRVRAETAPAGEPSPWADSTALRELEFLLSHTVHHYALIAVVCGLAGHVTPPDFGMAPSTLRHLEKTRGALACAR